MKVTKAASPLRKQAHFHLIAIGILWFGAIFCFSVMDVLQLLQYYGFLLLGFFCLMTGYHGRMYTIAAHGLRGERVALKWLVGLPSDYFVFTNATLIYDEKESETDLIVVGRKGVFIIEVKHHNGRITGKEQDRRWIQHKIGKKGGHYANPFYSPVKQVGTHVFRLSQILKDAGYPYWIQGLVYFSNREVEVDVFSKKMPVLDQTRSFHDFLDDFRPKHFLSTEEITLVCHEIRKQMKKP